MANAFSWPFVMGFIYRMHPLLMVLVAIPAIADQTQTHDRGATDHGGAVVGCALRELAFNFSQSLLPSGGADQDAAVASALRLESDCGIDVRSRFRKKTAFPASPRPLRTEQPIGGCSLFVATSGSDITGRGTATTPFASLHRAQQAISTARTSTREHCTINVAGGTYYLKQTLELGPSESNTTWIATPGVQPVVLSGGVPIPFARFKPSGGDPHILEADISDLNLTTVTPRGPTGGPTNRLFVNGMPMVWARYPDAPSGLPECALKIPLGRVGLSTPPRVGFMPSPTTPHWNPAVVANYSWIIPTVGPHSDAYYPQATQELTNYPNWSSPEWNGGAARPNWAGKPKIDASGMSPCYWDAVGGPFSRFDPPVGHGAPRTRTIPVAPVGVVLTEGSPFSERMPQWSETEWGAVQSMHWWHNVKCNGDVDGPNATGTVDCVSVKSGDWPGQYGNYTYSGPGAGDGYWGSWAWQIKSVDAVQRRIHFGSGGSQTTRGALNAGPWYVEGIREELTVKGEWVHSLAEQKVFLYPNSTSMQDWNTGTNVVAASLEQILAVRGNQSLPVVGVTLSGFQLRHSASHYTGPYPTCGGGDFCAARTGTVVVSGGENITLSDLDIDHPGGNGVAILDYNRDVEVAGCSLRHVGEVGFVVQGKTDGINATQGNYPMQTRIHHNFVYEVATKMRGGSFFFQSLSARTELDHNVALNGPRAGVNFNDGMGGGNNVHHNLIGNFVRESADHGNENSWDRVPFITTINNGSESLVPAWTRNHHNFWVLPGFGSNIDHDDGSAYYNDSYNVMVDGGGWTKHSGPFQMALGNLWVLSNGSSPLCAGGVGGDITPFADNTCVGDWEGVGEGVGADGHTATWNNSFYTLDGTISVNGKSLAQAQAEGLERGSKECTMASLGVTGIITLARELLGF
eukprot:m.181184 g.181184  ORF g.181184 m.181184 type:complete len:915 (-) comp32055_c0_seq4:30-2774(-)